MNKELVKVVEKRPKENGARVFDVTYDDPEYAGYVFAEISVQPNQPLAWMNARKHEGDEPPTLEEVAQEKALEIVARSWGSKSLASKLARHKERASKQAPRK